MPSQGSRFGREIHSTRHRRLSRILFILSILLVICGIVWPLVLAFDVVRYPALLAVAAEGFVLSFAAILLANYRIVRKGDEARIHSQKMIAEIGFPFFLLGGALVSLIGLGGWSPERVIDGGRSTLQFDAFLTVGWTISFGILERWSREFRDMRQQLIALHRKGVTNAEDLVLSTVDQPIEAVGTLMFSIALFIVSGTLALLVVLSANPFLLGFSAGALLSGVAIMLLAWYDLYRRAELLRYSIDTMPDQLRNSDG